MVRGLESVDEGFGMVEIGGDKVGVRMVGGVIGDGGVVVVDLERGNGVSVEL